MARYTKARRRAAALKGWRTRRFRASRPGLEVVMGYTSRTGENSYSFVIHIRPRKRLSDENVFALCVRLIQNGHFDNDANSDTKDLAWAAQGINYQEVTRRDVRMRRGVAVLIEFNREDPGGLP